MGKIITLILLFTSILNLYSYSQKELLIIVKKGFATISSNKISEGKIKQLFKSDTVLVSSSSLVLVSDNEKVVELIPKKKYTFKMLEKLFINSPTSFNDDFVRVIKNQNYHIADKAGSTSRGVTQTWDYLPNDDFKILCDSFFLKINQSNFKLNSDVKLYVKGSLDTVLISQNELLSPIKIDLPGEYHWRYENEQGIYDNYFHILSNEEKKRMREDYEIFKLKIAIYSEEMQNQLIKEYLFNNKLFL